MGNPDENYYHAIAEQWVQRADCAKEASRRGLLLAMAEGIEEYARIHKKSEQLLREFDGALRKARGGARG